MSVDARRGFDLFHTLVDTEHISAPVGFRALASPRDQARRAAQAASSVDTIADLSAELFQRLEPQQPGEHL